ncbi:hypothetical protein THMIRHAS_06590 [Thiosulfatimonas sediminis]|uniref:Uncharacterized protein n=1 Tax=Thiosulfatimonas sediminis TaxID=2675054 RepID=A0A6F8PT68_9GAMM|nr:hypothetical protein [Thiosulfatimonas sediminis]BBP45286.1 hypothetical protein THMIRHAS_06590 [Thiosulfatimonas sediminis]
MIAIREYVKVENHQVHITLPVNFDYDEVEVLILPKEQGVSLKKSPFNFSDIAGRLEWQGDALEEQHRIRNEWK